MGLYGLRDGRVATFAANRAADPTLPAGPAAAIRREYAPLRWIIPSALERCPPSTRVYYDQVAQLRGRRVLMGLSGLPEVDPYIARALAGKHSELVS